MINARVMDAIGWKYTNLSATRAKQPQSTDWVVAPSGGYEMMGTDIGGCLSFITPQLQGVRKHSSAHRPVQALKASNSGICATLSADCDRSRIVH
jgi:hypothetical protein